MYKLAFLLILIGAYVNAHYEHPFISTSSTYIGMVETTHRAELKEFLGVDPVKIPWCAAFINSVIKTNDYYGSEIVSDAPLTARSFLKWGEEVSSENDLLRGDIVVFPRAGGEDWQGHVGFYLETRIRNNKKFLLIISGNENNRVQISERPLETAIGFRRMTILD